MFSKGDLVNVHPRWTCRGTEDTVYIVTSIGWAGHCLELELLDPLGDRRNGCSSLSCRRVIPSR